jgi:uncharacterized protein (TIGR01777 family)
MKVLITGATGLIGTELVNLLLKNNITVNYLTIKREQIKDRPNTQGFYWNPEEGKIDENCIQDVDVIVHLAGASISKRWTNSYKQELLESRVLSSNLLFTLLRKTPNNVKQVISASAIAIYPDSHTAVYTENSKEVEDSFLSNVVVRWEESVDQFNLLKIKVAKIRTSMVFSEKGGALPEMMKPIKLGLGSGFGSGKQLQPWIHLDDIVNLYYFAITNQVEGILNGAAPETISNQELTKKLAKKLHKSLFLPNIPQFVMKLILGEMHILLFNDKNIVPQRVLELGFKFKFPTIDQALDDIIK